MPTCQQTMSVTVSGPFTIGPTSSPSSTSSHQRGSAPRGTCSLRTARRSASISSSVYGASSMSSYFFALARLLALGADHQPVLARQQRAGVVAEHLRGPFVDGPAGELARLVERARPARCGGARRRSGYERRPPLPRRSRRRTRGRRAAGRPSSGRGAPAATSVDLVLTDQRVAADQHRRRDRPVPARLRAVRGIAPQRVVVAVGHRRRCGTCRASARGRTAASDAARGCRCARAAGRRLRR